MKQAQKAHAGGARFGRIRNSWGGGKPVSARCALPEALSQLDPQVKALQKEGLGGFVLFDGLSKE